MNPDKLYRDLLSSSDEMINEISEGLKDLQQEVLEAINGVLDQIAVEDFLENGPGGKDPD